MSTTCLALVTTILSSAMAVLLLVLLPAWVLRKPPSWDRTSEFERAWQSFDQDWRDRHAS